MSQQSFFPYEFAAGALSLTCTVSGVETDRTASGAILFLDDLPPEAKVRFAFKVDMAAGTFDRVLDVAEREAAPCSVGLVLRSAAARLRQLVTLSDHDGYEVILEFSRSQLHQDLVVTPIVYRTSAGKGGNGYASHMGALLADGEPLQILLEEPVAPPGGHLDIEFEDFRQSSDPVRKRSTEALLALEIGGDLPKLWLNSGITNLVEIVNTRARRGANARIRDAMFQSMTAEVWTSLISTSAEALSSALNDGIEGRAALDELVEWKKRVLFFWAPRIYPWLSDKEQAVDELIAAAASPEGLTEVHEYTVVALQRYTGARSSFDGLIRLVTREGV